MLSGENSKTVEEIKTTFVPINAQLYDYCTKASGMRHRGKWV